MYAEVIAANGEFPGAYMTTSDGRLGVARLQLEMWCSCHRMRPVVGIMHLK